MSALTIDFDTARIQSYLTGVIVPHCKVHWASWLSLIAAVLTFNHCFTLTFNVSESLPQSVFLVLKGDKANLVRGEYVAFTWAGGGPFKPGTGLLKRIGGIPGDRVASQGRDFFVNDEYVGTAKRYSKKGIKLETGPVGRLPAGRYYVRAPHVDSLDSRYALTGWVPIERIVGRAIPLL